MIRAAVCGWLAILALACYPATAQASQTAQNWDYNRVNYLRTNQGMNGLQRGLQAHAEAFAERLARSGQLREDSGASRACAEAGGTLVGDNTGYGPRVVDVQTAFEHSPKHRANIMEPRYRLLGIGIARGHGKVWVVQDFCGDKQ